VSERRAFLIGQNGPTSERLRTLRYAHDDAKRLATILRSDRLGYQVLESSATDARGHLEAFENFASQSTRQDLLIFYFSGHGYLPRSGLYLLCDTTDLDRVVTTAMPLSSVKAIFENAPSRQKLLILDCCHSGAAAQSLLVAKSPGSTPREQLLAETRESASLVTAASERFSAARESPELEGGVMTSFLFDAFDLFPESDHDRDGRLSIMDMMEWLSKSTRKYNASLQLEDQVDVPLLYGDQRGDVFLTPELIRSADARLNDKIREAVKRLRQEMTANESMKVTRLLELARPMVQAAPTLTNLGILEELFKADDDAAIFAAATILRVRRDPAFMARLIDYLDPRLRNATLWRILRAIRDTLPSYTITPHGRDHLLNRIKSLAKTKRRVTKADFEPGHILGKCVDVARKMHADPAEILTDRQLEVYKTINWRGRTSRAPDDDEASKRRKRLTVGLVDLGGAHG
jgi:uncharacterized caspase-like protein